MGEEAANPKPGGDTAQRVALGAALVLIAVVGVVYLVYYRRQSAFYTARNLRVVRTMTAALDEQIAVNTGYVRNKVRYIDEKGDFVVTPNCGRKDVEADKNDLPQKLGAMPGREWIARTLFYSGRTPFLRLAYYTVMKKKGEDPPADKEFQWNVADLRRGCSDVALSTILQPAFNLDLGQVFDEIVVADFHGHVLYHVHPPRSRSTLLFESAQGKSDTSPLELQELGALRESKGWRDTKDLDLAPLLRASRTTDVVLTDESYILFSQPYTPGTVGADQKWIVGGLVSTGRFRGEVGKIPAPLAMLGTALAILAICAWPFLRIALMSDLEPITISDAVLIAICTVIAAAILTLAFLDTFAYMHLTTIAREQLRRYSGKLAFDYEDNVRRAAAALDSIRWKTFKVKNWTPYDVVKSLGEADPRHPRDNENREFDPLRNYPYFRSFAWVDAGGVERFKYSTAAEPEPRVNVSGRQYFIDAMRNNLWVAYGRPDAQGNSEEIPFAIEWVRSAATGRVTTAIAERTKSEDFPVILLATDLVDVTTSVPPPDVRFAVIDEQGNVLYHSDQQRIGYENFFTETNQNPDLRSAVLGRRADWVEANYWGDDTELYVRPLKNSPWTLVVFRAKRLVRVLNEEAVVLTLLPLLLGSMPYLLLYGLILVIAPRYRAPSLWPDSNRRGDYVRLARLYGILGVAFGAAIYFFDPHSLPLIVFLFPAQAIVSTYILLHRNDRHPRVGLFIAAWIALTALLIWMSWHAEPDARMFAAEVFGEGSRKGNGIVVALLIIAALASLAFFMPASKGGARRSIFRMSYSSAYRLCGAMLLALTAALPVVGYFKIATQISIELYTKYAQLRMATKLESRLNELAEVNGLGVWSGAAVGDVNQYGIKHVFESEWCLDPSPQKDAQCADCRGSMRETVPVFFSELLTNLSEDFVAMRMLERPGSADKLWKWCSATGRVLTLDRLIRLLPDAAAKLYSGAQSVPPQQHLVVTSSVPLLRESAGFAHYASIIGSSLIAFLGFFFAADFIARRLLLIDLAGPLWLRYVPLSPSLGDHIFLVRRDKSADELTGSKAFLDVSFKIMNAGAGKWNAMLKTIDSSTAGRNVRITDFEYGIDDGAINAKKLDWIERLLALPDRTVIIVSAVSAGYVYTAPSAAPPAPARPTVLTFRPAPPPTAPPADPAERWKKVLSRFVCVTQEQLDLPKPAETAPQEEETEAEEEAAAVTPTMKLSWREWLQRIAAWPRAVWNWLKERLAIRYERRDWVRNEAKQDDYLARIAQEIEPLRDRIPPGEEQPLFLDEIGERAGAYFAGLWASCSIDERILLDQLARNGLLNGKDRRLVRRLLARRFVRRVPQLEIFSETFRRYVLAAARRDDLRNVAATLRPSRWKDLRAALAVVFVAFALMLLVTQQDLFKTASGLITGLAAAVPVITKLLGLLGDRRVDARG